MKKRNNFNSVLEELKVLKTQLSEDYIFNGDEGMMDDGMEGSDPSMMQQQMPQQQQQMSPEAGSEEEKAMHAQEVIQHEPIIGKIRETAIEGIKKYADHPTSALYEFFKKVFLDADRVLTDNGASKK